MKQVLVLMGMCFVCTRVFPANRSFDIVYINLERNRPRRVHVERLLRYAQCSFRRFNAVDGRELCKKKKSLLDFAHGIKIALTDEMVQQQICAKNMGSIGCHLSHLIVLREIASSGNDRPVLILEDDIDLEKFFVKKIENFIANPPERWNVLLLGAVVIEKWWKRRCRKDIVEVYFDRGMHGYLVNGARDAERIADAVDAIKSPETDVDEVICDAFMDNDNFLFYCFRPMIAVQRNDIFDSDIRLSKKTFYKKYIKIHTGPELLRPLWRNSLIEASSSLKDIIADNSMPPVSLLFIHLVFALPLSVLS